MTVVVHTCYTLTCDTCGKPIESRNDDYPGTHCASVDEARAELRGDPDDEDAEGGLDGAHEDGRDICGTCLVTRTCAERGHKWWTDWLTCRCRVDWQGAAREPISGHEQTCPEWRYCDRDCGAHEERPVPAAVNTEVLREEATSDA